MKKPETLKAEWGQFPKLEETSFQAGLHYTPGSLTKKPSGLGQLTHDLGGTQFIEQIHKYRPIK